MKDREVGDRIALIDLDGTVADYDGAMRAALETIRSPGEPEFGGWDAVPPYMKARMDLIKRQTGFWKKLPRLELGFHIVEELRKLGFEMHTLTKGPKRTTSAWTEKVEWSQEHISDALVTVTQDKSLVYGRVLVDDFPPYFEKWLEVRPRGLVIAVAHPWNADVKHPNVVRYDGNNRDEVIERLRRAYERKPGEQPIEITATMSYPVNR